MLKYYRLRFLQVFSQSHNLKPNVFLRLNHVSSMPEHPVQHVLLIHIRNKTGSRQRINKKPTFLLGTEYALDYFNKSLHIWDFAAFCMPGIHPIFKATVCSGIMQRNHFHVVAMVCIGFPTEMLYGISFCTPTLLWICHKQGSKKYVMISKIALGVVYLTTLSVTQVT